MLRTALLLCAMSAVGCMKDPVHAPAYALAEIRAKADSVFLYCHSDRRSVSACRTLDASRYATALDPPTTSR